MHPLKASHKLPRLLRAVKAQTTDTLQPYVMNLWKQHLEINEPGSIKMALMNLFNLLFDNGRSFQVLIKISLKINLLKLMLKSQSSCLYCIIFQENSKVLR